MPEEHYYTHDPQCEHHIGTVHTSYRGHELCFYTDSGVFSRGELDRGSEILLNTLPNTLKGKLLDMGCGWGAIGVSLGKAYPGLEITMSDINLRACSLAEKNAQINGVSARLICADGYSGLEGEQFRTIVQNPPIRAGKAVIYQMFADAAKRLEPGGCLYLVIRKQQGAPSAEKYLSTLFKDVCILEKQSGYWIFRCSEPI